jgi:predicted  nucleic acid-binding Zn ribbon protein
MLVAELRFYLEKPSDSQTISGTVNELLGTLWRNGQICGDEWPIAVTDTGCVTTVLLPERDALDTSHQN